MNVTSAKTILEQIKKSKTKWIRLQFCNPFGLLHQLSIPSAEITAESFTNGFPLDGSSIVGFTDIEKSDIILVPDSDTFQILPDFFDGGHEEPVYTSKAARMFASVRQGYNGEEFSRDSRFIAKKAEDFAKRWSPYRSHAAYLLWHYYLRTRNRKLPG